MGQRILFPVEQCICVSVDSAWWRRTRHLFHPRLSDQTSHWSLVHSQAPPFYLTTTPLAGRNHLISSARIFRISSFFLTFVVFRCGYLTLPVIKLTLDNPWMTAVTFFKDKYAHTLYILFPSYFIWQWITGSFLLDYQATVYVPGVLCEKLASTLVLRDGMHFTKTCFPWWLILIMCRI